MTQDSFIRVDSENGFVPGWLQAIAALLPAKLVTAADTAKVSGRIIFGVAAGKGVGEDSCELQLPVVASDAAALEQGIEKISFSEEAEVPFPYRGRTLLAKVPKQLQPLTLTAGEKVLLQNTQGALWTVATVAGRRVYRTSLVPVVKLLPEAINGDVFVQILPVLEFLRVASGLDDVMRPGLRAGFIFDDPNLHWPRYGFVDYADMVVRARRENYHVSFATIPMDAWYTHDATAAIFRANPAQLSLCVHGNDHTKRELAGNYTESQRLALLQQAMRRIEKLERNSGVLVSRVMVPPHGACLESMLADLPRMGLESACISAGSLVAHNRDKAWTASLGYLPSEGIAGCPVMPRWAMTGCATDQALMAAYLGQAIVLRGHHDDLKNGVELLDQLARFVNGIGPVQWLNMEQLSRANYQWRMAGSTCQLRVLGRRVSFTLPSAATVLSLDPLSLSATAQWRVTEPGGKNHLLQVGETLPLAGGSKVEIEIVEPAKNLGVIPVRRSPVKAVLRRVLTEVRDRLRLN